MSYRVFIDMDGTLARFHAENNYLERMYEPSFFSELAPYENAVEAAERLAEGGEAEVFVISSADEAKLLDFTKNDIIAVAQTTQNIKNWKKTQEILEFLFINLII